MAERALFLVLEGTEGVGKSTQFERLAAWFDALGLDWDSGREPGGTAVGEAIRHVLLELRELDVPPETELCLMVGARAAFVRDRVRPALEAGQLFLADRFDLSTFAYQGFGRGLALERVERVNEVATGGLQPDLTLILDLPAEEGTARQRADGKDPDRIERAGSEFLRRVREGYRELASGSESRVLVDASGTPEEVERRIREVLVERFPETFGAPGG